MNEKKKLEEARFFFDQMLKNQDKPIIFRFQLSACLSAARSVLQYALEEAKDKPHGQRWYDEYMERTDEFRFFKDKRDFNIHVSPIRPLRRVYVTASEAVIVSESVTVEIKDKEGNIVGKYNSASEPKEPKESETATVRNRHIFHDWDNGEDVLTLVKSYLDELQTLIEEGIERGFLTR